MMYVLVPLFRYYYNYLLLLQMQLYAPRGAILCLTPAFGMQLVP